MRTWIPYPIDLRSDEITISDADGTLEVTVEHEPGNYIDGRQCSASYNHIGECFIDTIRIRGEAHSRNWLIDLVGADAVEAFEEWAAENLDATELAQEAA